MKKHWIILVLFTLLFVVVISLALADGTEKLGPPTIPIESGTGMVAAGTGMLTGSGTIEVKVPVSVPNNEVTIKQVLLYWEGEMKDNLPGDDTDTIVVNDTEVTGKLIGGPTEGFIGYSSSFRADITDLGLVTPGDTARITLEGLNFSLFGDGAGVLVIYEGSGLDADIELFDGLDLAFQDWPEPKRSTEPQTFKFKASTKEREAQLSMFIASVVGKASDGGEVRPNSIEVTTGGVKTVFSDPYPLDSNDGDEWDTFNEEITIPAGADSLTVQVFSRDDYDTGYLPASLKWIAAGLMVPPVSPELEVSKICTPAVFIGDEIEYVITVSNTGEENLTDVVVDDSLLGRVAEIDSLAVGASSTITKTMIAAEAGVITNKAWATGTIASSPEPVVSNTAECWSTGYPLVVTKDAQTSVVKRYNWEITKTVNDKKSLNLTVFPEQVVSPTYDVVVGLGSPETLDSDWVVSGTITVTNPAPMDAPLSTVTDVIPDFSFYLPLISKGGDSQNVGADQNQHINSAPPGISVPVSCPSLIVPAEGTLVCTYGPVDLSSGLTRTNTAFAELKNTAGGVFSGTTVFSGTAQVDFTNAEVRKWIDAEVNVTDSNKSDEYPEGDLGKVNVKELPADPFKYDLEMPSFSKEECSSTDLETRTKTVQNTAEFCTIDTETCDNDTATVNLGCIASASTGFEDLPYQPEEPTKKVNDWDYNDAFVEVRFDDPPPTFTPDNDLLTITLQFTQTLNLSAQQHEFHIRPEVFKCDGFYWLKENDVQIKTKEEYNSGDDLKIIADTGDPDNTAELRIEFTKPKSGDCHLEMEFDPFEQFNGENLFYAPGLWVKNIVDGKIAIVDKVEPGDPRMVGVPDDWAPPGPGIPIWEVYPDVVPPKAPGLAPTFVERWWE